MNDPDVQPDGVVHDGVRRYRISSLSRNDAWEEDGHELADRGIAIRLEAPVSSEVVLLEAMS